jgi:hypothetical protein
MMVDIKEPYINNFNSFINSLPQDAITVKKSLDEEIQNRVDEYRSGKMKTTPFMEGLDEIRENLVSQL